MQIVINHMTRMGRGYCCVAGVDLQTLEHVRPVVIGQKLSIFNLARYGGPLDMANLVDLGPTTYCGKPPQTEDYFFDPQQTSRQRTLAGGELWTLQERLAENKLSELFGPDLRPKLPGANSLVVELGKGMASLGCLRVPARSLALRLKEGGRIRCRFHDGQYAVDASVTDIRLYERDHVTPDEAAVARLSQRLKRSADAILAVGLTQPYSPNPETEPELHWLQINSVHLRDEAVWQLG